MPRPTDVVFRNFNELTYIDPEDVLPRLPYTPYYPKKYLVHFVEKIPQGRCEYWLLESGKTLLPLTQLLSPPLTPTLSRSPSKSSIKTLSPLKLYKNKTSQSLPSPPLSPTKSFCYPPTPPSRLSRLKFWKKQALLDHENPEPDATPPDNVGSEFERMMWKTEHSTKQSPSRRLIDPEDEEMDTNEDDEDLTEVSPSRSSSSQTRNPPHPTFVSFKQRLRAVSVSSLPPVEEHRSVAPLATPAQRTPIVMIQKEAKSKPLPTERICPIEPYSPTKSNYPTKRNSPVEEHICSFLDYRTDAKCNKLILDFAAVYFHISFFFPWIVTEFFLDSFSWIPFFRKIADYIIANGGGTLLLLLSAIGAGLASLPLCLVVFVLWPFERLHELIIFVIRSIPWYKFRDSLGCPIPEK
ncbi:hypothetical protein Clacol_008607 [Clathrus columnatus]|uniref:Uncharacterized protein n=1 Tax=Clathrus columnatus TaxID=1419009 RepID=A0AAV5ALJ6_9AGAM|nr:hypothetical protein Clacol_008607 [Clathrus columnatus]